MRAKEGGMERRQSSAPGRPQTYPSRGECAKNSNLTEKISQLYLLFKFDGRTVRNVTTDNTRLFTANIFRLFMYEATGIELNISPTRDCYYCVVPVVVMNHY